MDRLELEDFILDKLVEIETAYKEFNPKGGSVSMSINRDGHKFVFDAMYDDYGEYIEGLHTIDATQYRDGFRRHWWVGE